MTSNIRQVLVSFCLLVTIFAGNAPRFASRSGRLGLGPICNGCPPHFCDDDRDIIHGYCCGCARFYDNLPVSCSPLVRCPLNNYELCQRYEYMMHCCC